MPKDFQRKQPTRNEQMFYDMAVQMQSLDNRLWTTSSFVSALGILTKADPQKIAELLTTGQEEIKNYSQKINDAIGKIEEAERAKRGEASAAEHDHSHDHAHHHHDHDHAHDHSHDGHDHSEVHSEGSTEKNE